MGLPCFPLGFAQELRLGLKARAWGVLISHSLPHFCFLEGFGSYEEKRGLMGGLVEWLGSEIEQMVQLNPNEKLQIRSNSKNIDAYTQKDRKWHFELNGMGLESKFYRLRKKMIFWAFKPNYRYYI